MRRMLYLAAAAVLALVAALLTLRAQHTVAVLVATRNVQVGAVLQSGDVQVQRVHDDGSPAGSLTDPQQAVGMHVVWPLTAGEPVLDSDLRQQGSGNAVSTDFAMPAGYRAVALPVSPAGAVGGLLVTGDHVDVYATPLAGHETTAPAGSADATGPGAGAVILGHDVVVIELRSDQGTPLQDPSGSGADSVHGLNFSTTKLGSVVLAVPSDDAARYAAAAAADTIFLALTVS